MMPIDKLDKELLRGFLLACAKERMKQEEVVEVVRREYAALIGGNGESAK